MAYRLHLDYETASECDIRSAGAYKYARHPSTRILMLGWSVDDEEVELWEPHKDPEIPPRLFAFLTDPNTTKHAFNAAFERQITMHCLKIDVPPCEWRCTMVEAYYLGFAGSLDNILKATGLETKDDKGKRLINVFSKPAPKNHKADWYNWENKPDDWELFCDYCRQDVKVERYLWHWMRRFPGMTSWDWRQWYIDQEINDRGVKLDLDMAQAAINIWDDERAALTEQLKDMTGLPKVTRGPFLDWMKENTGVELNNLSKDYLASMLTKGDLPEEATPFIDVWAQKEGKAVSKYVRMIKCACADERARGMFQYKGASRTDRVGGRLIQLQNLKRPFTEEHDTLVSAIKCEDPKFLSQLYGMTVSDILGGAIRHAIQSKEGHSFAICDLASIESVVLGWLTHCQKVDDTFRNDRDTYKEFASKYYGVDYDDVTKAQRTFSKPPVLGCGYQLGWKGLMAYAEGYGVEMEKDEAKLAVNTFRNMYPEIPRFWKWIVDAVRSVTLTYAPVSGYRLFIDRDFDFLRIWLPSGRAISYYKPEIVMRSAPWKNMTDKAGAYEYEDFKAQGWTDQDLIREGYMEPAQKIENFSYMGMDHKNQWSRIHAHGGLLTENCVSHGTEVWTDRGWVPLEQIQDTDMVHDGIEFVSHRGLLYKGVQTVIDIDGVSMTPDHEVLTNEGWRAASEDPQPCWVKVGETHRGRPIGGPTGEKTLALCMRMWGAVRAHICGDDEDSQKGRGPLMPCLCKSRAVREENDPRDVVAPCILRLEVDERPMQAADPSIVEKLRRTGDTCVRTVEGVFREFLGRHGSYIRERSLIGQSGQRRGVLSWELPVGKLTNSGEQQTNQRTDPHTDGGDHGIGGVKGLRDKRHHLVPQSESRVARGSTPPPARQRESRVYDILNAGPRQRFVVKGASGAFIVHNCVQSIAGDLLWSGIVEAEKCGLPVVLHVHDEIAVEIPEKEAESALTLLQKCMTLQPVWCRDMWLGAAGFITKRYTKD